MKALFIKIILEKTIPKLIDFFILTFGKQWFFWNLKTFSFQIAKNILLWCSIAAPFLYCFKPYKNFVWQYYLHNIEKMDAFSVSMQDVFFYIQIFYLGVAVVSSLSIWQWLNLRRDRKNEIESEITQAVNLEMTERIAENDTAICHCRRFAETLLNSFTIPVIFINAFTLRVDGINKAFKDFCTVENLRLQIFDTPFYQAFPFTEMQEVIELLTEINTTKEKAEYKGFVKFRHTKFYKITCCFQPVVNGELLGYIMLINDISAIRK